MSEPAAALMQEVETVSEKLKAAQTAINDRVFGQAEIIEETLITLLAGGHGLLVGVPGLAKTRLVETMGTVLGLEESRVQFTPDLMPADIIGSEVLEEDENGRRSFRFIKGPIFCQLLMADEINRASPRTQSALLQAMQEKHVTVTGQRHDLPALFHVLATQNPLEQEGTYPLPEAQLDRFLMQINVDYPDEEAERQMILATTGVQDVALQKVLTPEELQSAQTLIRKMPVGEKVVDAILNLVRSARPGDADASAIQNQIAWGPGPRASQALMLAARARALLQDRVTPSIDDVVALAPPVLRHRMALTFSARAEGVNLEDLIQELLQPFA